MLGADDNGPHEAMALGAAQKFPAIGAALLISAHSLRAYEVDESGNLELIAAGRTTIGEGSSVPAHEEEQTTHNQERPYVPVHWQEDVGSDRHGGKEDQDPEAGDHPISPDCVSIALHLHHLSIVAMNSMHQHRAPNIRQKADMHI